MLLGLGFTFFSGAVEAWLVDALTTPGTRATLEPVFARGQMVGGVGDARRVGAGGVIAQATNLGVPFLLRGRRAGRDVRRRLADDARPRLHAGAVRNPLQAMKRRLRTTSIDYGCANPPVRWLMLAAPFAVRGRHLHLLRPAALPARAVGRTRRRTASPGSRRRSSRARRSSAGLAAPWIRKPLPDAHAALILATLRHSRGRLPLLGLSTASGPRSRCWSSGGCSSPPRCRSGRPTSTT